MQSCMSSEKELRIYDIIYGFTAAIGQHRSAALTKQLRDSGQNSAMNHDLAILLGARADNPLPKPADWEKLEKAVAPVAVACSGLRFVSRRRR
jgi:hypothetical protein